MKKLNLGCGRDSKEGYVNLDCVKLPGVNVVHDLNKFPYPFKDEEFDEIICKHILEHITDLNKTMIEIHRILKKGGILKITVPHFTSSSAWTDPQHVRAFGYFSFDYFHQNTCNEASRTYSHETKIKFNKLKKRLIFGKSFQIYNWIIECLANKMSHAYEDTFSRIFPALELYVELEK